MRMPGFSAEVSVYRSRQPYGTCVFESTSIRNVTPQQSLLAAPSRPLEAHFLCAILAGGCLAAIASPVPGADEAALCGYWFARCAVSA